MLAFRSIAVMRAFGGAFALLLGSGCETARTDGPAPSSTASRREVLSAAVSLERSGEGRQAALGSGQSMAPIYGDNSVVVTEPIAFEELEAGMIVAFYDAEKRRVIHQLTRLTRSGWRSKGINNDAEDDCFVTPENLIGVVYAVFQGAEAGT